MADVVDVAVKYVADFGWSITPVAHQGKNPILNNWQSSDLSVDELRAHFSVPRNVGVKLGAASNNLVDVDIDFKGVEYPRLLALAEEILPKTTVRFGRKSKPCSHWLYRCSMLPLKSTILTAPEGLGTIAEIRLGAHQQTVIPPSVHVSGEDIEWDPRTDFGANKSVPGSREAGPPDQDYADLERAFYQFALSAYLLAKFPPDGHNARLALIGWLAWRGWPEETVSTFVSRLMRARGHGEEDVLPAVGSTFRRLAAGEPVAGLPVCKTLFRFPMSFGHTLEHWEEKARPLGVIPLTQGVTFTEYGLSVPIAYAISDDIQFCPEHKEMYAFDSTRWRPDDAGVGRKMVVEEIRRIRAKDVTGEDDKQRAKRIKTLLGMETYAKVDAILRFARINLITRVDQFDTDPWLLNCSNMTLDLRDGSAQRHNPEHRITNETGTAYDPSAQCPKFEKFIVEVFPDPDIRDFLQRLFGYCLTGLTEEHVFPIFHGPGNNGKSTLLNVISDVLGDYATPLPSEVITRSRIKSERHPTELAVFYRKRFVIASESEMGQRLDESRVKELTGGDTIKARRMREDFWSFRPTHKLVLQTNYLPEIRGQDRGIRRRLIPIPCDADFVNPILDLRLQLRTEASGILNWCLRGLQEWKKRPLRDRPSILHSKLQDYQSSQDEVFAFLQDRFVITRNPEHKIPAGELYTAYRAWCALNGADVFGAKALAPQYRLHGLVDGTHKGARFWAGIRPKTAEEMGVSS